MSKTFQEESVTQVLLLTSKITAICQKKPKRRNVTQVSVPMISEECDAKSGRADTQIINFT